MNDTPIASDHPALRRADIEARALLARTARDLGAPGRDEIFGHGLLQSPGDRCW